MLYAHLPLCISAFHHPSAAADGTYQHCWHEHGSHEHTALMSTALVSIAFWSLALSSVSES